MVVGEQNDGTESAVVSQMKRRPSANFMESMQQDINPSMRGILVDWLVEVRMLGVHWCGVGFDDRRAAHCELCGVCVRGGGL